MSASATTSLARLIIDCDIHPDSSPEVPIEKHIPAAYHAIIQQGGSLRPVTGYANPFGFIRRDAGCNSPAQLREEHLDRYGITYGVLQPPGYAVSVLNNSDVANVMATAWNDWQIMDWLAADARLRGSICVNMNDPSAAVREIRRARQDARMVQVVICGESRELYGHRQYWPVYEACAELGLPLALHPGQEGAYGSSTPVGRPVDYLEWHTGIPLTFQAHVVSLVCAGVFEKFPLLRVAIIEAGVSWLAPLAWRFDKNFKGLRSAVPWLREAPSDYIFRHFRFSTQPLEEPPHSEWLAQLYAMVQAERTVMFASDFPHWDFDDPRRALPTALEASLRRRILWDNAAELYHLTAPAGAASTPIGGPSLPLETPELARFSRGLRLEPEPVQASDFPSQDE